MKKILLIIFFSINIILAQTVLWQDNMNGNNSIAGLQARGWIVLNVDGGGSTNAFYQGQPTVFSAFEGPDSGYVAANYLGANNQGLIDQWLISPSLQILAGDTLFFYARRQSTSFSDSINILISDNAGTTTNDFTSLGRFLLSSSWNYFTLSFGSSGTRRFAVEYYMADSSRANFIGLDYFRVLRWSVSLNKTFTFGDITQPSNYRMIGIPGDNNFLISDILTGDQNKDWNVYFDNGEASNYLIQYDGTSTFNIKPGRGFWVLSKNSITYSKTINAVPIQVDNTYSIPLHNGWNIISNPFEKDVSWSDVQQNNGLGSNDVIWSWNGSWSKPSTFSTYSGFYFYNTNNLTSLKIPYPASSSTGKISEQTAYNLNPNSNLKISLVQNGKEVSESFVNFDSKASNSLDSEDYFAPPGDFDEARINLYNQNLPTSYKQLFVESRSAINNGQSFDLHYKNITGENITLKVNGIENFPGDEVYLLDKTLNQFYNLMQQSTFLINPSIKKRNYSLLIGTAEYINSLKTDLMPHEFSLYQNYPNPFNPTTTIRYQVPMKSHVNITIYDILGNEVKTLVNKEEQPGSYEVEFNGQNISSGVYFYRITSGSFTQTKKMLLLK